MKGNILRRKNSLKREAYYLSVAFNVRRGQKHDDFSDRLSVPVEYRECETGRTTRVGGAALVGAEPVNAKSSVIRLRD